MLRKKNKDKEHAKEMVRKVNVSGYEEFKSKVKELSDEKKQLNILFTGEKNAQGISWCPDCNNAEPFILKAMTDYALKDSIFLEVEVGDRETYKDRNNPFRLDKEVRIREIPTLLRWNSVYRLDGDYCAKPSLLQMFFEEPDHED